VKSQLRKDSKRLHSVAGTLANAQWCREEFGSIEFGDKRLNERLIQTAAMLAQQPLAGINQACPSWADTKAAYRLFSNERCRADEIQFAHAQSTIERIKGHRRVLVIQDSSTLNFNSHPATQGLGKIGKRASKREQSQGLWMHTALAVVPHCSSEERDGLPLGLLDQKIWARSEGKKKNPSKIPIEEKESYKWLETLQNTIAKSVPQTEFVTVCDREADIFEFMHFAQVQGGKFLIRNNMDRRLYPAQRWDPQKDGRYGVKPDNTLRHHLSKQPLAAKMTVKVARKAGLHPDREAIVEVRFAEVELEPPPWPAKLNRKTERLKPVKVHAIWVKEINPPKEITDPDPKMLEELRKKSNQRRKIARGENPLAPLEWLLLTNVWVEDVTDALERVRRYEQRWQIECFHKVLKSGCAVENSRLQYADRLEKYIALTSVIAWRLHWMSLVSRREPNTSVDFFLSETEWKALYCKINKTSVPPKKPPTIYQSVRWIAQLGGFLGRKSDGEPGTTTLWRGWQRLHDITEDWIIFKGQA
jgi:hypothetical protein